MARTGPSEFDGKGVEASGVYDKPSTAMSPSDKYRLLKATGQDVDAKIKPDPRVMRGERRKDAT